MMLDIHPSPETPRFVFGKHDEILISGRSCRLFETRGNEHFFVRADGTDVVQKLTNSEISRWLVLGNFICNPNVFLPESERSDRGLLDNLLSTRSAKEKKRAAYRESLVLAFLEMYHKGEVKRTDKKSRRLCPPSNSGLAIFSTI